MRVLEWLDAECNSALVEVGWRRKRWAYVVRKNKSDTYNWAYKWVFRDTKRDFPITYRLEWARTRERKRRTDEASIPHEWFPAPPFPPRAIALPPKS